MRSILNKLTPENFQKLTNEVTHFDLAHKGALKQIVSLIFEKAVDESKYCRLYALLCLRLNEEVPNYEEDGCVFTSFQFWIYHMFLTLRGLCETRNFS